MIIYRASAREAGGCNFCRRRVLSVIVVADDSGHGPRLVVRICRTCLHTLCREGKQR